MYLLLGLCWSYQPDSNEGPLAWRQWATVRQILGGIRLSCKAQASRGVVVQSSGKGKLLSSDRTDEN